MLGNDYEVAEKKAEENNLNNFKVMLADADNIEELIDEKSIDVIYLHFSDPWPKKRQHKRRLTYMSFLKKYEKILKNDGCLIFKTDNESFYDDSIEYFKQSKLEVLEGKWCFARQYFCRIDYESSRAAG